MLEYSRIGTGLDLVMHQIKKKISGFSVHTIHSVLKNFLSRERVKNSF